MVVGVDEGGGTIEGLQALLTLTSPPMSWQNLRVIVRPRPVPPYRLVVDESAWVNG